MSMKIALSSIISRNISESGISTCALERCQRRSMAMIIYEFLGPFLTHALPLTTKFNILNI